LFNNAVAMAIYTPRGLKIRITVPEAFALMSRLYPKVDAFRVLKVTEGMQTTSGAMTLIAAIVSFSIPLDPMQIGLVTFLTYTLSASLLARGVVFSPALRIGIIYSYFSGFGIAFAGLVIYGYLTTGIHGLIGYAIGKFLAHVANLAIEFFFSLELKDKAGIVMTTSELYFINAYRWLAQQLGVTTDITLKDSELEQKNWLACYTDLVRKWPEVVKRFN
jgi:hypothetical protein